jgi:hypothetical protein
MIEQPLKFAFAIRVICVFPGRNTFIFPSSSPRPDKRGNRRSEVLLQMSGNPTYRDLGSRRAVELRFVQTEQ